MARKKDKNPYLFSENEKSILSVIHSHHTPLDIHIATKIPRPTVYTTLEKLEVRNLIQSQKIGSKRKWILNPDVDINILIKEKTITDKNTGVHVYTSQQDILNLLNKLNEPSETRLQILSGENILKEYDSLVGTEKMIEFNEKIKRSNLIVEMICTKAVLDNQMMQFGDEWAKSYIGRSTEVHILDKKYLNHNRQIFIYNNNVYFFMLDRPAILEISDENLVNALISIFDFIKDYSANFDMNGYMKERLSLNKKSFN